MLSSFLLSKPALAFRFTCLLLLLSRSVAWVIVCATGIIYATLLITAEHYYARGALSAKDIPLAVAHFERAEQLFPYRHGLMSGTAYFYLYLEKAGKAFDKQQASVAVERYLRYDPFNRQMLLFRVRLRGT